MTVLAPTDLDGALAALAERPDATVLAGGTDLMVELNFGHRRAGVFVSLRRVRELREWSRVGDELTIGATVTYTGLERGQIATLVPALAQAARTVGSPQIRNAGTIGGNLATASPAGDTLPVLSALDAVVVCASASAGRREVSVHDFLVGPKRSALAAGELVVAVRVPVLSGPQEFLKVGTRNAMVISIAGVALVTDAARGGLRCALGSVGPTALRAADAESFAATAVEWPSRRATPEAAIEFGRLTAGAARPIDDHRATAHYRRHAVEVCARRAFERVTLR